MGCRIHLLVMHWVPSPPLQNISHHSTAEYNVSLCNGLGAMHSKIQYSICRLSIIPYHIMRWDAKSTFVKRNGAVLTTSNYRTVEHNIIWFIADRWWPSEEVAPLHSIRFHWACLINLKNVSWNWLQISTVQSYKWFHCNSTPLNKNLCFKAIQFNGIENEFAKLNSIKLMLI